MTNALEQTGTTDIVGFDPNMDIKSATNDQLTKMLDAKANFNELFTKIETELTERIDAGIEVDGYALLPGRASQQWVKDADEIAKALKARRMKKDEIYPAKLISPAQALKHPSLTDAQKENIKKNLISMVAGKDKLTKVVDKPKTKDVSSMFMDEAAKEKAVPKQPISFL